MKTFVPEEATWEEWSRRDRSEQLIWTFELLCVSRTRLFCFIPKALILFFVLWCVRAIDELLAMEVANTPNQVAKQGLAEAKPFVVCEWSQGLVYLEILLLERFQHSLDRLGQLLGRRGLLSGTRSEQNVKLKGPFKGLLHNVHVAWARLVLNSVSLPRRRHVLLGVFFDICLDSSLQRLKENSCLPRQMLEPGSLTVYTTHLSIARALPRELSWNAQTCGPEVWLGMKHGCATDGIVV